MSSRTASGDLHRYAGSTMAARWIRRLLLAGVIASVVLPVAVLAQSTPRLEDSVTDLADVLDSTAEADLEEALDQAHDTTHVQLWTLFVDTTDGATATDRVVFKVNEITVPEFNAESDEAKRVEEALRKAIGDDVVTQFLAKLEKDIGVTINQAGLNQISGGSTNN